MKNQWVADSADYGKYGLLRSLCCPDPPDEYKPLRLGVVWYLTPNDGKVSEKHWDYLNPTCSESPSYGTCDPALYGKLAKIARSKPLSVDKVEGGGVFPKDTVFYSEPVPGREGKGSAEKRKEWAVAAQERVAGCDLVFVDPDTGLESSKKGNTGPEYVRVDELPPYRDNGQSLVVYQHLGRSGGTMAQQAYDKKREIERGLGPTFAMLYARPKNGWVIFL